uniref:Uncharacterized protein n=1 Tax=Anguilla anguilla TaxID=7936 RepID=A0A0E9VGU7_ANGAN
MYRYTHTKVNYK